MTTTNPAVAKLPTHLKNYIIDQNYSQYTWRNQAVWRYVMRRSLDHLSEVAHESYLQGLQQTGVGIDKIPSLEKMNEILEKIGWGAVCVDGFIPPAAFMEFQAHKVLVIAADIRSIDQIEYTPAPDIIHEAAGHAPIIANADYAEYLRKFGEIGSKAFSSFYDHQVYEAIRHLSILKADPHCSNDMIKKAEYAISDLEANPEPPSEMALIRNLHWWTVEYGLIGSLENPKIYGAGLLSSIGESVWALSKNVKKIEYTLEAMDYSFDITKPQPQLFVTPNFIHLNKVLDEFICSMSLSIGGIHGMNKAIESENLATAVMKSGLQISGIFSEAISQGASIVYIQTKGPTTLNFKNQMLEGHGVQYHAEGYGTAVGKIKGSNIPMRKLCDHHLTSLGMVKDQFCKLEFDSGLQVKGVFKHALRKDHQLLLLSFEDCTVRYQDKILFQPDWGAYDLAIGEHINSVFAGVADAESYGLEITPPAETTHKVIYTEAELELFATYGKIRKFAAKSNKDEANELIDICLNNYPNEFLLLLEALEFIGPYSSQGKERIKHTLANKHFSSSDRKLIDLGLNLIKIH
ncbi:MAG: aromatic amino acid hydroxylase [Bacteroidales bacterium]|nr:aromatic amino acid hydroxylase [Bacteroidales bacterium]